MKTTAHIDSQPPATCRVRMLSWFRRHPEVSIGLFVGIILSFVLLFILNHAVQSGLTWLAVKIATFISDIFRSLADQFRDYPKG
jgi:hypothetical protein